MQQRSLEGMRNVASVLPVRCEWNRKSRLMHLALILEQRASMVDLKPLSEAERLSESELRAIRFDSSPMALAFADLELHRHGLKGDTLGHAMDFFDLTTKETHDVFCGCMYGNPQADEYFAFSPKNVARRLRKLADNPGFMRRVRGVLSFCGLAA